MVSITSLRKGVSLFFLFSFFFLEDMNEISDVRCKDVSRSFFCPFSRGERGLGGYGGIVTAVLMKMRSSTRRPRRR